MSVKSYRDLEVWQKGMDLAVTCYHLTGKFPKSELYGLTSQLQRAAVSIPANIAEGATRLHTAEFIHFLSIGCGSLAELETHVELTVRLSYIGKDEARPIFEATAELGRMLNGLIRALKKKNQ